MKFSVLGPVRAWREDTELNLGAPQQRALLAMLLLAAGRQVTLAAIINGLWEDDPPPAAVGTVRTYVSRLRRCLQPGGPERGTGLIRSEGTGYVVPAEARVLDLETFDRMTKDARTLISRGSGFNAQAATLLRDALKLRQGEPLADVPGPYARSQRVRIRELQLAAAEERLALDIELGGHVGAAAELQSLLAAQPMRERLSELLMLALYRAGRQIDALAVYESTRRLLGDEFGIDPGPALREMQQRILQTDVTLLPGQRPLHIAESVPDVPQDPPALAPTVVPAAPSAQLPADLPVFAGRCGDLGRLDSLLAETSAPEAGVMITVIDGMAGIGKTTLAVRWAREIASQYSDGQLYADLRGFGTAKAAASPGEVLSGFLEALGADPARIPEDARARAGLYRSMLRDRRVLVLLDNARDAEQVRPLLPASPGCLVIVTSRNRLLSLVTAYGACAVTLEPLPRHEAEALVSARIGKMRLAAEPQAAGGIIDRCAGLPLALAVVAARAALYEDLPLSEIAGELWDPRTSLDALSTDDAAADVRTVLSWAYRLLSEPARRLFRLLAVHSGPDISRGAAASLAGLTKAEAQPLIAELTGVRLLSEHRPGRLSSHELTQVYAAELGMSYDTPADRREALARVLDYYLHMSYGAHMQLQPQFVAPETNVVRPGVMRQEFSGYQQAMAWFDAEWEVLQAAVRLAAERGFHHQAWQLALAMEAGSCHLLGRDAKAITELEQARKLDGESDCPAELAYVP
ncbi:MAG TPA: BTAD domain-containing putative transcriptional regulator [Trebonia sp.]